MRSTVDILILGAGWTSTFLIPLCEERGISQAATSRAGRDGTIAFEFDPHSTNSAPFQALPHAHTVLITFPIKVAGASERLVKLFQETHPEGPKTAFVQLGSTGIWDVSTGKITPRNRLKYVWCCDSCLYRRLSSGWAYLARAGARMDRPPLKVRRDERPRECGDGASCARARSTDDSAQSLRTLGWTKATAELGLARRPD